MDLIRRFSECTGEPTTTPVAAYCLVQKGLVLEHAVDYFYANPGIIRRVHANPSAYAHYVQTLHSSQKPIRFEEAVKTSLGAEIYRLFCRYKEPSPNAFGIEYIGYDGTLNYLTDLSIDPEQVEALVLAYYLNAREVGVFERDSFVLSFYKLGLKSLEQQSNFIKAETVKLKSEPLTGDIFKAVYKFTFPYSLDKDLRAHVQKQMNTEEAIEYLKLLIPPSKQFETFINWLHQSSRKFIKKDEWNMIPSFINLYQTTDILSTFTEEAYWPLMMDEFVEFLAEQI